MFSMMNLSGSLTTPQPQENRVATATETKSNFFDAALEVLSEKGYGGLKQSELCSRLGLTTGAFYHSFESWRDFTDQLLANWHEERTTQLADLARDVPDPIERLEVLIGIAITLPHRAEAAIRVWSNIDERVREVQAGVDQERFAVIAEAMSVLVPDPEEAATHARTGMYLLVGFEQSEDGSDTSAMEWGLREILDAAKRRAAER